ncbi:hypothetical protein BC628DRAFT_604744 [Trametes gibbosa]|nr:hypothetical protein BC628DRAFT_604744 [Trametes gibbosa]
MEVFLTLFTTSSEFYALHLCYQQLWHNLAQLSRRKMRVLLHHMPPSRGRKPTLERKSTSLQSIPENFIPSAKPNANGPWHMTFLPARGESNNAYKLTTTSGVCYASSCSSSTAAYTDTSYGGAVHKWHEHLSLDVKIVILLPVAVEVLFREHNHCYRFFSRHTSQELKSSDRSRSA